MATALMLAVLVVALAWAPSARAGAADEPRWSFLIERVMQRPGPARAEVINHAINQFEHEEVPGSTAWQTPQQLVQRGIGDCKDFALAKFWLLRHAGAAPESVRLAYGDVLLDGAWRLHLVVLLWSDGEGPWVLDNLVHGLFRLADRYDLRIAFSFDDNGFYDGIGQRRIRDQPLKGWAGLWTRLPSPGSPRAEARP